MHKYVTSTIRKLTQFIELLIIYAYQGIIEVRKLLVYVVVVQEIY